MNDNGKVSVLSRHSPVVTPELMAARRIQALKWPRDAAQIARLPLESFQVWVSGIDPRELIFLAQNPVYKRFVWRHYLLPVRILRLWLKVRRYFGG